MRIKTLLIILGGLSIFFSPALRAHHGGSEMAVIIRLVHNFTGEHLLMLILVIMFAAVFSHLYHRFR